LSLRVAEIFVDILNNFVHLCDKNNIPIDKGIYSLMEENEILLRKIEEIGSSNTSYTFTTSGFPTTE
jgi:hypothetical protein